MKDGSGFTRRRFVVRRAVDSWRRQEGCANGMNDGKRNGRIANGRRGTMACMACGAWYEIYERHSSHEMDAGREIRLLRERSAWPTVAKRSGASQSIQPAPWHLSWH